MCPDALASIFIFYIYHFLSGGIRNKSYFPMGWIPTYPHGVSKDLKTSAVGDGTVEIP